MIETNGVSERVSWPKSDPPTEGRTPDMEEDVQGERCLLFQLSRKRTGRILDGRPIPHCPRMESPRKEVDLKVVCAEEASLEGSWPKAD